MMVLLIMWTSVRERDSLGALRGDVIAGTLYGSNWFQAWQGAGYTAANDFAPLRHLWSLGVEEQFYLVWPVVMLIILRRGRDSLPRVATWFVGIAFVIAGLVAILMPSGRIGDSCVSTPSAFWNIGDRCLSKIDLLYLSTPTRATGLLLGAALAIVWRPYALLRGPMKRKGKLMDPIAVLGLILLAFLISKVHIVQLVGEDGLHADPWLFRGGLLLTGVATLMIIAAVAHQKALTGRILGNVVLRVIGERSYGLYLYHWPIFQAIRHETGIALKPHEFLVGILITVLVAEGSYRLIELPIRERRLRESLRSLLRGGPQAIQRRSSFAAITACSLLLPIFAVVSLATAEQRPNEVQASLDAGDDAVTNVLAAAREFTTGRVIAVLGCGGDRDSSKRPLMGAALAQGADIAIFTSDNPRSEAPAEILSQMTQSLTVSAPSHIIEDREDAIRAAVALAQDGDTVLVLGKGHETGQDIAGVVTPFDDRIVLAQAIEAKP